MKKVTYTQEELELVEYMETNPPSVPNVKELIDFIQNTVKEDMRSKKQVNLRTNHNSTLVAKT